MSRCTGFLWKYSRRDQHDSCMSPASASSALVAAGVDVRADVIGMGAADFQRHINQALTSCNWFVFSPTAIGSPLVELEPHSSIQPLAHSACLGE